MSGILFAILAGSAMSLQGVMNTRLSEKIGLYESNAWVQGTAFLFAIIALVFAGKGSLRTITEVENKLYLSGGLFGIIITVTVMLSIGKLSPTVATGIILIAQLAVSALINAFGWFDSEKIAFGWRQYVGLFVMIGGIFLFRWQK